ncbi:hypothetical protein BVRB_9g224540 [Beta vulgaris subsp. vulgaris]|uniref:Uncharacterized protein n=1 Tax=Beta vulgaris subsp. vulgaris TaxID=3555 RepID=A0A0J8B971_BETVV|nr:hypothetical protein BVRB_9g224540 [Beta vulgaris subsp. vulgaris]
MLINARSRFDPPISDDYFGNLLGGSQLVVNVEELLGHDLGWAAMKLHKTIMGQDGETICGQYKGLAISPMVFQRGVGPDIHGPHSVVIGGSARFDIYGPEFGLGRPLVALMGYASKDDGKVTANPGCKGGGSVDLEISLKPHYMAALELDYEFMSYVSLH